MPLYDYRCPDGHVFDEFKPVDFSSTATCPTCKKRAERQFSPAAIHVGWRLSAESLNNVNSKAPDKYERNM